MKKYKVLNPKLVTRIEGKEYIANKGDVIELPDTHITTQALVERKRIEEYKEVKELKDKPVTQKSEKSGDEISDLEYSTESFKSKLKTDKK